MSKPSRIFFSVIGLIVAVVVILFLTGRLGRSDSQSESDRAPETGTEASFDEQAMAALAEFETRLAETPIQIDVGGTLFNLVPSSIRFNLDERAVLDLLLETRSPEAVMELVSSWNRDAQPSGDLYLLGNIDNEALSRVLDRYNSALAGPYEGGIGVEGTTPVPRYPQPGQVIDRNAADSQILGALLRLPRPDLVTLVTAEQQPIMSVQAVDEALNEAYQLLGGPVTLTRTDPDVTLFLTEEQMANALLTKVERGPTPRIAVTLDPAKIDEYLQPLRSNFEAPPVDARIIIDDEENITILPGFSGARIDTELVVEAIEHAARKLERTTVLPLNTGLEPTITARDLYQVTGKISEFTTMHPCCQPRVKNIRLFAIAMDGRMVLPGEVMSLNDTVGERTLEDGYVPAPTIVKGEITDTVGGGVSQFATTFYNAVFWAGLEILEHKPHSFYFSRYPEGIEATISWKKPDLIFRNDTEFPVIIKTAYTGTSITVKVFGNNSDRTVSAWVSDRYAPTEIPTEYIPNPEMMPWEEEVEVQEGAEGWSVTVTRQLDFTNGSTTRQDWTVRYRSWPRQVEVHPCLLDEEHEEYTGEECPVDPNPPIAPDTEDLDEGSVPTDAESEPDDGGESEGGSQPDGDGEPDDTEE